MATGSLHPKHAAFCLRCLRMLPSAYESEDANRLALAHFALSALSVLGVLHTKLSAQECREAADWIYTHQLPTGGFRGSPSVAGTTLETAHLVNSYAGLLSLLLLDDDLSRLDRKGMLTFVATCQAGEDDGSFAPYPASSERDVRSTYAAFAICHVLGDWSRIRMDQAIGYLLHCKRYDGGFAQMPFGESHGGSAYCVIASLALCGRLEALRSSMGDTLDWLVHRQIPLAPPPCCSSPPAEPPHSEDEEQDEEPGGGHQGRPHKDADACYSFWISAAIKLLSPSAAVQDERAMASFLLACQHDLLGGIASRPDSLPDLYHTFLALAALSLEGVTPSLQAHDPALNISSAIASRFTSPLM